MEQDKQETPFRIGGIYRDVEGDVIRLIAKGGQVGALYMTYNGWREHDGYFDLATGKCQHYSWCDLLPGELTLVNGEWISMTPTLDKLEARGPAKSIGRLLREQAEAAADSYYANRAAADPNAAMIARDGPAKVASGKTFYDQGWNAAHDGDAFDPLASRDWRDGWGDYHDAGPEHKVRLDDEPSTAKAALSCFSKSPDLSATSHLVDPAHQTAIWRA